MRRTACALAALLVLSTSPAFAGDDDSPWPENASNAANIRAVWNLDGGWDAELERNLERYDRAHPGRFATFCRLDWDETAEPGFGFFSFIPHREGDDEPKQLIVPIGAVRSIEISAPDPERPVGFVSSE